MHILFEPLHYSLVLQNLRISSNQPSSQKVSVSGNWSHLSRPPPAQITSCISVSPSECSCPYGPVRGNSITAFQRRRCSALQRETSILFASKDESTFGLIKRQYWVLSHTHTYSLTLSVNSSYQLLGPSKWVDSYEWTLCWQFLLVGQQMQGWQMFLSFSVIALRTAAGDEWMLEKRESVWLLHFQCTWLSRVLTDCWFWLAAGFAPLTIHSFCFHLISRFTN